jgi:acid phosphatase type 7
VFSHLQPAVGSTGASDALPSALAQVLKRRPIAPGPGFAPLPEPRGPAPYRRALADVLGAEQLGAIQRRGELRFHCVGDTGGWRDGHPQHLVAAAMADELTGTRPVDFFYHLGDVVYPHGEEGHYRGQFFSAYGRYCAPIFAIPGNHDGEAPSPDQTESLWPFLRTFCSASPPLHDVSVDVCRPVAQQPHVHWTLVHDWVRIIGLYTNVHEDGEIAEDQLEWLTEELRAAPRGVTLILAVHRPVYSVDIEHGSNLDLGDALDRCFVDADRLPDAVFAAHAHNYQRFARVVRGRSIPYLVAGSGGFYERHEVGSGAPGPTDVIPGLPDVTLEAYQSTSYGYMTVTAGPAGAEVVYLTVSERGAREHDRFSIVPAP